MTQVLDAILTDDIAPICAEIETKINKAKLKLPVLPQAIQKVLAMNNDPEFDISELSRQIHLDHTLAGHVLKVSNSSVYAGAYKTNSLSQAISRLGGQALVKIAVSVTMQGEIFKISGFKEEVKNIWRHSLASAIYAQRISELGGSPDPGMYMCGLMHQVGKPVLLQTAAEIAKKKNIKISIAQVEKILDRYHAIVGYQLATGWKLPASVKSSCLHYTNPEDAKSEYKAVNVTHLASRFADIVMNMDDNGRVAIHDDPVLLSAGISTNEVDILLEEKEEVIAIMQALTI